MMKFLHEIKDIRSRGYRQYLIPVLVLLFLTTYLVYRPHELFAVATLYICEWLLGKKLRIRRIILVVKDFKKTILVVGVVIFLIFSFFNTRLYSYDGLNFHIRVASLVRDNGRVSAIQEPTKPYFGEFLLGYIWRYFGLRAVNLTFGLWAVIAGFLGYHLIKEVAGTNTHLVKSSFILFILSPPFLAMALHEFKPDLLLLIFALLSFLLLVKLTNSAKTILFLPLCLLAGTTIIIKTSFIPTAALVVLVCAVYILKKNGIKRTGVHIAVGAASFVLPFLIWSSVFGVTIPLLENVIKAKPIADRGYLFATLTRDPKVLNNCYAERVQKDYSSFIYGARSPLVLIQPFYYLTRFRSYPFSIQGMANPGPFIYLGVFIFIIFPLLTRRKKYEDVHKLIYIICTVSLFIFFIAVSSIYWYLLFMFPFICLVFVSILDSVGNVNLKNFLRKLINAWLASTVLIFFLTTCIYFHPVSDYSYENLPGEDLKSLYTLDKRLEKLSDGGLILNASEHGDFILLPFMKNSDTRVIKSNYYFASSHLSLEAINRELKDSSIKYIVVNYNKLNSSWYQNCPKENNTVLKSYLDTYTRPIFFDSETAQPFIFEIVN